MSICERGTTASRRGFLQGMTAFGTSLALPVIGSPAVARGPVRLKIGVLSDIHIRTEADVPRFERTLRKLDEWKVDGVLGGSDIADYGLSWQLDLAAEAWFRVFPNGRSPADGREVANLLHYGDHDMATWYVDREEAKKRCPDDAKRKAGLLFEGNNRKTAWERAFKEPFEQIAVKTVKGYTFVLSHFTRGEPGNESGDGVPGLADVLSKLRIDPGKPFFYSQHRIPRNTAGGAFIWGQDDGRTTQLFGKYPNLIAFSGHSHRTAVDERNIWQGAFTSIQTPSHSYCCTDAGRENGYCFYDRPPKVPAKPSKAMSSCEGMVRCSQGYLMSVYDDAVVIRRWEFDADAALGPDWVIPVASFEQKPEDRPYAFARRAREARAALPAFQKGASVKVSGLVPGKYRDGTKALMRSVAFPPAPAAEGRLRANDYSVTVEVRQCDCVSGRMEKHVYSPGYLGSVASDVRPVVCRFGADEIPDGWESRFVVRPLDVWGNAGEPICSEWRVWSKED